MRKTMMVLATTTFVTILVGSLRTVARADFDFPVFTSTTGLNLIGDAARYGTVLRLTPANEFQTGAVWYTFKQYVQYGFETSFQFEISELGGLIDENGHTGADGFALVIQSSGIDALGGLGAGMGYSFILNSLAVEFDTWWNHSALTGAPQVADPNDNHLGIHTHIVSDDTALEVNSLATATPVINLSDNNIHTVHIEYNPPTMKIFLDDMSVPILTANADLATFLNLDNGHAFVGFTAATASAWENHDVLNWSFKESLFFGDLQALVSEGALNSGQGQALTAKLEAALASLKAGKTNAACGQLQAYMNQVKALVNAGILTPQQGHQLSDHASQVRSAIGC